MTGDLTLVTFTTISCKNSTDGRSSDSYIYVRLILFTSPHKILFFRDTENHFSSYLTDTFLSYIHNPEQGSVTILMLDTARRYFFISKRGFRNSRTFHLCYRQSEMWRSKMPCSWAGQWENRGRNPLWILKPVAHFHLFYFLWCCRSG